MESEKQHWIRLKEAEKQALAEACEEGWLKQYHAPPVDRLTQQLTKLCEKEFCRLCCSGTVTVELALRGVGVTKGDRVLLAGYDFPGNFRCIEAIGARPALVDVAKDSWQMDYSAAEKAVKEGQVQAVLVSFLHGSLADIGDFYTKCQKAGVPLVLDGCQQPGARVLGQSIAKNCDAFCLSFGGSKLLSAGRGGAVLTDDPAIHQRMEVFAFRGNDAFPLSVSQACLLGPQVSFLEASNQFRWSHFRRLCEVTSKFSFLKAPGQFLPKGPFETSVEKEDLPNLPAFYKFGWILEPEVCRNSFLEMASECQLPFGEGFKGFHRRSKRRCDQLQPLKNTEIVADRSVLLHHTFLSEAECRDLETESDPGKGIQDRLGTFERFLAKFA